MLALKEIPDFRSTAGWEQVPIKASGEPLINLEGLDPQILCEPLYIRQGIPGAVSDMYLRAGAGEKLITAARMLPPELALLVWDSHRLLSVQASLFDAFSSKLKSE